MKRILMTGLTALLLAACSHDELDVEQGGVSQDYVKRYIAFTLQTGDDSDTGLTNGASTRTDEETGKLITDGFGQYYYYEGTNGEYKVLEDGNEKANIVLLLYDDEGSIVPVVENDVETNAASNVHKLTWHTSEEGYPSVELGSSDAENTVYISVLKMKSDEEIKYPTQMLILVNPTEELVVQVRDEPLADVLEMEKGKLSDCSAVSSSDNGFLMTNAVYRDNASNLIKTTSIGSSNIGEMTDLETTQSAELITAYVERVVAKVKVNYPDYVVTDGALPSGVQELKEIDVYTVDEAGTHTDTKRKVYVRVNGWSLFNEAPVSHLVKDMESYADNSWAWNSTLYNRSFWAVTDDILSATTAGATDQLTAIAPQSGLTWSTIQTYNQESSAYTFENTLSGTDDNNLDAQTSVILAAQLCDEKGEPQYLAWWNGLYFDSRESLLNYIAQDQSSGLTKDDIVLLPNSGDAYHLIPYKKLTSEQVAGLTADELSMPDYVRQADGTVLMDLDVTSAKEWCDGMCYYFTAIPHPKVPTTAGDLTYVNAVVRNHSYNLTIKLTGFGTPVPEDEPPFDPVKPDKEDTDWDCISTLEVLPWKKEEVIKVEIVY